MLRSASILGISAHTVDAHLRRVYLKLGVFDRMSAALRGLGFGLIAIDGEIRLRPSLRDRAGVMRRFP